MNPKESLQNSKGWLLFELGRQFAEWRDFDVVVELATHENRKEIKDEKGHCENCCMFDEDGNAVWLNDNCKGCEGYTVIERCINETSSWLMEVRYCDRCDADCIDAYTEGTATNATYYAKNTVRDACIKVMRTIASRDLREALREAGRDWCSEDRFTTAEMLGRCCGIAWALGASGKEIVLFLESIGVSWSLSEKDGFCYSFWEVFPESLEHGCSEDWGSLAHCPIVFPANPVSEQELKDFWIRACPDDWSEPGITSSEKDSEIVTMKVFLPLV